MCDNPHNPLTDEEAADFNDIVALREELARIPLTPEDRERALTQLRKDRASVARVRARGRAEAGSQPTE